VVEGARFEISCARSRTQGSNPCLSAPSQPFGEVTEWLKVLAWNASVGQLTGGSNPPLSVPLFIVLGEGRDPQTGSREPRQVREEATVVGLLGAVDSPVPLPSR
jgi:hypothetical protein